MRNFISSRCFVALLGILLLGGTGCTKRARASRHLQRANNYFAANQFDRAEIEYLNVMRLEPTNTVAIRYLGEIYYVNEAYQRAAAFLSAARQRDPNDFESRGKLARLMLSSGAVKEARAEVDAILKSSPTNENALLILAELSSKPGEAKTNFQRIAALQQKTGDRAVFHVSRGIIALKQNDEKTGESELKTAVALEPKSAVAQIFLGGFYVDKGSNALAEPCLKTAADLSPLRSQRRLRYASFKAQTAGPDAARPIVNEITSTAPDYIPAWLLSARLAFAQTNYTQTTADLKHITDREPINFEALLVRSDLELAQNKPNDAVKTLDKLVEAYPKSAVAQYRLGLACIKAKDMTKATVSLNQAVARDPLLVPAVLLLCEINVNKGESAAPIDSLSRLIKAYPGVEKAYILLGTAYMAAGRFNDAITTYNQALQKFPRNSEAPHLIGIALKQQGRYDEARKVFANILQTNPDDRFATMELIGLDIQDKDTGAAAKRIQGWIDRSPSDPTPVFEMAKLRYYLKDTKGTQELLEKVIAMNKDAVPAYVMLGRLYMESNQIEPALQKTKEALAKNSNDTGALLLAAIIYENKRDYNSARDTYEKFLSVNPRHVIVLNNLAALYAERFNDLDKAYSLGRQAQDLAANTPQLTSSVADTYGWILSLRGEYGPALALLKDAAQSQPTEPEIQGHLGITQYMADDESGARLSLQNALKLSPSFNRRDLVEKCLAILNINPATADQNTIAALEKRLQESPADAVALARLTAIYEKTGKADKALALYEKAVAANPKSAIAIARLADLNDQKQNSAKALELAKNARKLDSTDPEIAHIAGRIATKSSDLNDQQWGLTLLQESSQKKSTDASVAYDLAWAYYAQGRIPDAETSMKAALASGANQPFAANAKRFLDFLALSEPARAAQQQAQIDQALQADPNYLPALAARAASAQQKGDTATALKTDDQILARYPGFTPAARNFVVLSAGQPGDASKPIAVATRVREQFRDDADFVKAVGILQYQKADYQNAARTLADVAKKRPNDETVQYYLGMSHYQLKQPKESKVALKKAIDLQPKAPFASEVQKILNEIK